MNSRHRTSHLITGQQVERIIAAATFAYLLEYPLNVMVTVNMTRAEVHVDQASFVTAVLKRATDWLRYNGDVRAFYVWVRESHNGSHVHVLIHVPHDLFAA